jgi:hypothetical protein
MKHLGDYDTSTVIYGKFTTFRPSTGAAYTLGGTPALSVYKDNSTTQSTTGVTLTADFDAVTGLNHYTIDTSTDGTFYSAGSFFDIVITTGTVDSVSVVGSVVGSFTIRKDSALKPTTAGRTLDVSATGEAGVDWANIGSPTTVVNLSGTTVKTATDVETDTADIQTRLPAALVSGRIDASVGAIAANAITAASMAADASTEISAAVWSESLPGAYGAGTAGKLVGDNINAPIATVDTVVDAIKVKTDQLTFTTANQVDATTVTVSTGAIGTGDIAAAALNEIADAILDRNMATGTDSGSTTVRTPRQAMRVMRNKVAISAGTATVYKEDDATASWTASVTTSAGDPISAVDPAGP